MLENGNKASKDHEAVKQCRLRNFTSNHRDPGPPETFTSLSLSGCLHKLVRGEEGLSSWVGCGQGDGTAPEVVHSGPNEPELAMETRTAAAWFGSAKHKDGKAPSRRRQREEEEGVRDK